MAAKGVTLATNASLNGTGSSSASWPGGRAALVLSASAYGSAVNLQLLAGDNTTWISLNGTTFSVNQLYPIDLPAGQYRIFSVGATTALYASLVGIPYT